jgi:hypothetical protein
MPYLVSGQLITEDRVRQQEEPPAIPGQGLFVGTVNPYFGLQVWLGVPNASTMTPRKP